MNLATTIKRTLALTFVSIAVVAGGLIGWGQHLDNQHQAQQQAQAQAAKVAANKAAAAKQKETVSYDGIAGQTALQILRSKHTVGTKTYSFGDLVESIDGVTGTGPKYWTFYVNGKMSDVGASTYVTQPTDKITWKLEQQ